MLVWSTMYALVAIRGAPLECVAEQVFFFESLLSWAVPVFRNYEKSLFDVHLTRVCVQVNVKV